MPTTRFFAYNSTPTAPTGASQFGNVAVSGVGFQFGGGLQWYNGPDEEIGYVISHDSGARTAANNTEVLSPNSFGFWRTTSVDDSQFISLSQRISVRHGSPQTFADGYAAKTWLNDNGYWTSYGSFVTSGLTLKLDAANTSSYPGTGTTWYDLISPQQNITLVNSPTWTSGTPAYFTFNGSNQRGSGTGTGVLPQTQYTKSVWFYLNAYVDNNLVSSDTGGHFMYFASGNKLLCGHANWSGYGDFPSVATINLNTWYYAALTFNTTDGMKLYINGVLDSTYTANKTAHGGDGSVNIASFGVGNLLNGRIGKVYCYDRSISASEVLQNYNVDKAHFGY